MAPLRRICLTGAECTGKSTLAPMLAAHYGGVVVPEYSRVYAERVGRELRYEDVEPIARGTLSSGDMAAALQIFDTDLVSTVVYARHHYGDCPAWIVEEARNRKAGLYLLLDIDVPWIADGVRDSGATRARLHNEFAATLRDLGAKVVTISGEWEERLRQAVAAIDAFVEDGLS
jgi:nicotinamide riboside kinase